MAAAGPRVVLVSGGGGSGRSTVAAATAGLAAESGQRTLLIAADDPNRTVDRLLDPALGTRLGPTPVQLAPGLSAAALDPQAAFRDTAESLLGRARTLFDLLGVEALDRDEITALPGASHLALLDALRTHGSDSRWDTVVVDAPPVPELIAALALPEQLDRYLARLLPEQRQAARALRPVLAAFAGVPMPADWLFEARARAAAELAEVRAVTDAPGTTVRLVTDAAAGPRAAAALRTARAGLALHGRRVESLIVNRLLPDGTDPFLSALHKAQQEQLAALRLDWDVPVAELPHLGREPRGLDDPALLTGSGALRPARLPGPAGPADWPVQDLLGTPERVLVWRIPLPGADRADLDLVRRGDELALSVGPYRRTVLLPSALRRCTVAGAALREGVLAVRFAPDPRLWPR